MTFKVLDLFCGAGGAARGYADSLNSHELDFEIVGVDTSKQPDYPYTFVIGDATTFDIEGYDFIHASPPCQHFTRYRNVHKTIGDRYSDHIASTQALLINSIHVIENVCGAPIRKDLELCGSMFGLDVRRHRWFEFGNIEPPLLVPPHNHLLPRRFKSSSGRVNLRRTIEIGAWDEPLVLQQTAMGIDWITDLRMLSEAIPPAYTRFIMDSYLSDHR